MHYNEVKGGKVFVEALPPLLLAGLLTKYKASQLYREGSVMASEVRHINASYTFAN